VDVTSFLSDMFRVMMEHPLLMVVLLVDIALIVLIVYFISSKVLGDKKPGVKVRNFIRKFFIKLKPGSVRSVESLYDYVVDAYVHRGVVPADLGSGFRARQKIMKSVEGEEKQVVEAIFYAYEGKKYGGGVFNEEKTVSTLFDRFRSL
jgi:hypothetical protein